MNPAGHTIRSLIDQHAETSPDRLFVKYPESGISHTWSEFQARVQSIARYLKNMDFPPNVASCRFARKRSGCPGIIFGWNVRRI